MTNSYDPMVNSQPAIDRLACPDLHPPIGSSRTFTPIGYINVKGASFPAGDAEWLIVNAPTQTDAIQGIVGDRVSVYYRIVDGRLGNLLGDAFNFRLYAFNGGLKSLVLEASLPLPLANPRARQGWAFTLVGVEANQFSLVALSNDTLTNVTVEVIMRVGYVGGIEAPEGRFGEFWTKVFAPTT